jgi:hypothetical protein
MKKNLILVLICISLSSCQSNYSKSTALNPDIGTVIHVLEIPKIDIHNEKEQARYNDLKKAPFHYSITKAREAGAPYKELPPQYIPSKKAKELYGLYLMSGGDLDLIKMFVYRSEKPPFLTDK